MEDALHKPQQCPKCGGYETATLKALRLKDHTRHCEHWCATCSPDKLIAVFRTREIPPASFDALMAQRGKKKRGRNQRKVSVSSGKREKATSGRRESLPPVGDVQSPPAQPADSKQGKDARPPGYTEPPGI